MKNNEVDYNLVLQAVSSYLIGARSFFGNYKNIFSIGLIPDGHHIYTGTLKATGYRLLRPNKTLVLVGDGVIGDKLLVMNRDIDVFMGKRWNLDKTIISLLKKRKFVEFVDHTFDWVFSELPFLRIISEYDNLVFIEIGDDVPVTDLLYLFEDLVDNANLMFISDLHKNKPMDLCKKLDQKIMDLSFVQQNKDLFLVELFLSLSSQKSFDKSFSVYLNSGDISTDKETTNGFACLLSGAT